MANEGFDRRSFIKTCVGVGATGAAAAAGAGMLLPLSDVDVEIVPISYPGVQVLEGSPAPYGLPIIPLEITGDGELRGVPDAFDDQLQWYRYCGHERTPGALPDWDGDDMIRFHVTEERQAGGLDTWYADSINDAVRWQDFPEDTPDPLFDEFPGAGAPFRWRSEGMAPERTLTGIVLRAPAEILEFTGSVPPPQQDDLRQWMPEHPEDPDSVFLACMSRCTHFCCIARFHEDSLAVQSGYGDRIFCTCHLSRYDPFTVDAYNRTIFRYPETMVEEEGAEAEAGGGQ